MRSGGSASEAIALASDASGDPIVDWTAWGACEWMIDSAGGLVVRPANGADVGYVTADAPWLNKQSQIKSPRFEKTCRVESDDGGDVICSSWFRGLKALEKVDLTGLDMSNVTHVPYMFSDCTSLTSVNLSGLDSSSVTDVSGMFSGCTSLTSLDLSASTRPA